MVFLRGQDLLPPSAASLHRPPNQHQRGLRLHLPSSPRSSPSSTPCAHPHRHPLRPQRQGCLPLHHPRHRRFPCRRLPHQYRLWTRRRHLLRRSRRCLHHPRCTPCPTGHGAHACATRGLASGLRRATHVFVFVAPCTTDAVTAIPRCSTGGARSSADVSDAAATGDTSCVGRRR